MEVSITQKLEEEVKQLANEQTGELLPLLLEKLMARDGLDMCPRHSMLDKRIRAEIALTKARRATRHGFFNHPSDPLAIDVEELYERTLKRTLEIRKEYRSRPCTCWVPKR